MPFSRRNSDKVKNTLTTFKNLVQNHWAISAKLGTMHPWTKTIQAFTNERPCFFSTGIFFFKFLIILKLNRLFWGLFITRNWFLDEHYGPVASWFLFSFPFLCKTTGTLIKTQIGTNHSKVKRRPHHKVSCVWKYQITSFSLMEVLESVEVYRMGNSDTRTFFQREMIDNI